ncbi:hypothetical protein [Liquorilactobacillus satsumensis]|uniref:hypothetical protein n=1 Tax=Liquorilactobacillus satsumensis TaxID=259059 RepID=UPI0021C2C0DD|nr:hypothetical protein [Liquorilactobacillus satsumensis]MCP9329002.1 hypothetical protein [Liquorilactobacillus satsumensis]
MTYGTRLSGIKEGLWQKLTFVTAPFLFYVSGILGERLRIRKFLYNCGERLVFKAFRAQGGCCKAKNTRDKKVGMVVYKDLKA